MGGGVINLCSGGRIGVKDGVEALSVRPADVDKHLRGQSRPIFVVECNPFLDDYCETRRRRFQALKGSLNTRTRLVKTDDRPLTALGARAFEYGRATPAHARHPEAHV